MNKFAITIGLLLAGLSQGAIITETATLSGANENPGNGSPGFGSATVSLNDILHTLTVDVTFSGLTGTTAASHIHCCTAIADTGNAGVATQTPTFSGFPLGVTSGTYHNVFDTTLAATWNAAFITGNGGTPAGAESALKVGLLAGTSYLNIHTTAFPGGEIRGFLTPEPASVGLLGAGLAGLAMLVRRRRASSLQVVSSPS